MDIELPEDPEIFFFKGVRKVSKHISSLFSKSIQIFLALGSSCIKFKTSLFIEMAQWLRVYSITTLRYNLTPIRMTKIKNSGDSRCW